VNLKEVSNGVVESTKKSKEPKNVDYIVLELVGGELFDYVALTGRFTENVARFYFT